MQPSSNNLSAKWFSRFHGTEDEKKDLEQLIRNSTIILDILTRVLETDLRNEEANRTADYQDPNWAYRQADRNGVVRTLKNLLSMTKLTKGSDQQ